MGLSSSSILRLFHPQTCHRRSAMAARKSNIVNPFDSEDEAPALSSSKTKPTAQTASHHSCNGFHEASDDSDTSPFDDAENVSAHESSQRKKFSLRSTASSLGDSALRRAHRLKQTSKQKLKKATFRNSSRKTSAEQQDGLSPGDARAQLFDKDEDEEPNYAGSLSRYNDELENKSVQELEAMAIQKSEDTTGRLHNCLKIAEDIKGDATRTVTALHEQGEQIKRTHEMAVEIDQQLSKGEKMLGSLGGIFSRTWKPRKSRSVTGPIISKNDSFKRRACHSEERASLGLESSCLQGKTQNYTPSLEPQIQTTQARLEAERSKQDDALSDLSNVLDQLKDMSLDMGSEISRQNESLEHLQNDIVELGDRMKGANTRARRLLGK